MNYHRQVRMFDRMFLGQIQQKTEEVIGPYELHDFFIYHFLRNGSSPTKLFHLTKLAYGEQYSQKEIQKWLKLPQIHL